VNDNRLPRVIIYSRADCHLCDVVQRMAHRLQKEIEFDLEKINLETDRQAAGKYASRIPVVLINQKEGFSGKVTEGQLRRAIEKARWRNPISRILFRIKLTLMRR
jgi:glutaredoxin